MRAGGRRISTSHDARPTLWIFVLPQADREERTPGIPVRVRVRAQLLLWWVARKHTRHLSHQRSNTPDDKTGSPIDEFDSDTDNDDSLDPTALHHLMAPRDPDAAARVRAVHHRVDDNFHRNIRPLYRQIEGTRAAIQACQAQYDRDDDRERFCTAYENHRRLMWTLWGLVKVAREAHEANVLAAAELQGAPGIEAIEEAVGLAGRIIDWYERSVGQVLDCMEEMRYVGHGPYSEDWRFLLIGP